MSVYRQIPKLNSPRFLQRLNWISDPVGFMEKAAKQYPDIFAAEVVGFGNNLVYIHHPQGIQQLLKDDRQKLLAPGEVNRLLTPLLGDNSIVMLEGDPANAGAAAPRL